MLIDATYQQAVTLIRRADTLVVIGYSFNPHDPVSYGILLAATDELNVVLVGPDADRLAPRMRVAYPRIRWTCVPSRFRDWVRQGYPGLDHG